MPFLQGRFINDRHCTCVDPFLLTVPRSLNKDLSFVVVVVVSPTQPCKQKACLTCGDKMLDRGNDVLKILGGVGLFFSFTEVSLGLPSAYWLRVVTDDGMDVFDQSATHFP